MFRLVVNLALLLMFCLSVASQQKQQYTPLAIASTDLNPLGGNSTANLDRAYLVSSVPISSYNVRPISSQSLSDDDIDGTYNGFSSGFVTCPDPNDNRSQTDRPTKVSVNPISGSTFTALIMSSFLGEDGGVINVTFELKGTVAPPGSGSRTLTGVVTANSPLTGQGTFLGTWFRNQTTQRDELRVTLTGNGLILGGSSSCNGSAMVTVSKPLPTCSVQIASRTGSFQTLPGLSDPPKVTGSNPKSNPSLKLDITVIDPVTGRVFPRSQLSFVEPKVISNPVDDGHDHMDDLRPTGKFTMEGANPDGRSIGVTYKQSDVAGRVSFKIQATTLNGTKCISDETKIDVKVNDLSELFAMGPIVPFALIGKTKEHTRNHFGTTELIQALADLAQDYYQEFGDDPEHPWLSYNDMSLPWGGKFDIDGTWSADIGNHVNHRDGVSVDVRTEKKYTAPEPGVPMERRGRLLALAFKHNLSVVIEGPTPKYPNRKPHWHLTSVYGPPFCDSITPSEACPQLPDSSSSLAYRPKTAASSPVSLRGTVQTSFDTATGLYTYRYTFANDASSTADVSSMQVVVNRSIAVNLKAPEGWNADVWKDGSVVSFAAMSAASTNQGIDDGNLPPSPFQIRPNQSLSGFSFQSPDPPGSIAFLGQGYKPLPVLDEDNTTVPTSYFDGSFEGKVDGPLSINLTSNRIDNPWFFVRQHYLDFLNRDPDDASLIFRTSKITSCGIDQACIETKRQETSTEVYLSMFQNWGFLVERIYKSAYGDAMGSSSFGGSHSLSVPIIRFSEFLPDMLAIGRGVTVGKTGWETVLENNKQAFAAQFVERSRFTMAYPTSMSPAAFVSKLAINAGSFISTGELVAAINLFSGATDTSNVSARAKALRQITENQDFSKAEFNRAFVLLEFFGYLRRNPQEMKDTDYTHYDSLLAKLNQFNGNFSNAEIVKAFITSTEYRERFGLATTDRLQRNRPSTNVSSRRQTQKR